MADPTHVVAMVVVSSAITWALRALPFAVLAPMRRSTIVRYLGTYMPLGIMVILAFYTLRDVPTTGSIHAASVFIALIVTVALHLWRRNALLSIVGGTAVNAVLASFL